MLEFSFEYYQSPNDVGLGNPTNPRSGCNLEGMSVPCDIVARMTVNGATRIASDMPQGLPLGFGGVLQQARITEEEPGGQYAQIMSPNLEFFQQPQKSALTPLDVLKKGHSFGDADSVLLLDENCRDFFTKGRSLEEVRSILNGLGQSATYEPTLKAIAGTSNSGQGKAARITLFAPFFADDNKTAAGDAAGYSWSPSRGRYEELYTSLYPRQYRALTILHELAHALGLIPSDKGKDEQSKKNNSTINDECGSGLNGLPDRD